MELTTTTGNLASELALGGLITFRVKPMFVGQDLGNIRNERSYSLHSRGHSCRCLSTRGGAVTFVDSAPQVVRSWRPAEGNPAHMK